MSCFYFCLHKVSTWRRYWCLPLTISGRYRGCFLRCLCFGLQEMYRRLQLWPMQCWPPLAWQLLHGGWDIRSHTQLLNKICIIRISHYISHMHEWHFWMPLHLFTPQTCPAKTFPSVANTPGSCKPCTEGCAECVGASLSECSGGLRARSITFFACMRTFCKFSPEGRTIILFNTMWHAN